MLSTAPFAPQVQSKEHGPGSSLSTPWAQENRAFSGMYAKPYWQFESLSLRQDFCHSVDYGFHFGESRILPVFPGLCRFWCCAQ
jgi:hypothetical protein